MDCPARTATSLRFLQRKTCFTLSIQKRMVCPDRAATLKLIPDWSSTFSKRCTDGERATYPFDADTDLWRMKEHKFGCSISFAERAGLLYLPSSPKQRNVYILLALLCPTLILANIMLPLSYPTTVTIIWWCQGQLCSLDTHQSDWTIFTYQRHNCEDHKSTQHINVSYLIKEASVKKHWRRYLG